MCLALRLVFLVLVLAVFVPKVPAQSTRLKPGQTLEGDLSGGQSRVYVVKLKAGQYMQATITQANPEIIAEFETPAGTKVIQLDPRNLFGRSSRILWVASTKGSYRINLSRPAEVGSASHYTIHLDHLRASSLQDRQHIEAEQFLAQGLDKTHSQSFDQAMSMYARAIDLYRRVRDREGEGETLNAEGDTLDDAGEDEKALGDYQQALEIERELKDRRAEALILNNIGNAYFDLGQFEKAISYYDQTLVVAREIHDRRREAGALGNLGNSYSNLSQYEKAIANDEKTVTIFRELKDRFREGISLGNLGIAYANLNQFQTAITYYEQALAIDRELKNRQSEGLVLGNLGDAYAGLEQYEKAIGYQEQALAIHREVQDPMAAGNTLTGLGLSYINLKQFDKAIGYYEEARKIFRERKDRAAEGAALDSLADAYRSLVKYDRAADYYMDGLAIAREAKDRRVEADVLFGLMETWQAAGRPGLAIFYGKQAVNTIQSVRSDISGLNQDLQQSFLKGNEKPYHVLAELLIAQGRLAEAEQVLALLKEEEYFQYVRRDSNEASGLSRRAELTPDEAEYEERYREIGDRLMKIGEERGELLAQRTLTPEQTQRLMQLEQDLAIGNQAFERFLGDLTQHFSTKPELNAKVVNQLREEEGFMEDLRELPAGTAAIYTIVGDEKFHVILRTPDAQKAYEYPIKAADLNRKVFEFREAVSDPHADPRPLGQELYQVLVAPMAEDLRQAKAQTLMWSLDGALRYLPIAALYDGKQYLIERYRVSVMTLASNARLKDQPDRAWSEAGFGVTKKHGDSEALPDVKSELDGIQEILHGEIKLDEQFTETSMRTTLLKRYPVVHIASHFRFVAGDQSKSFLLLGDGGRLSLAELKTLPNLFSGVQLLTLSACNTGVGDGTEVEGFGTLAQRQGAKAVIASLWPVADSSTSLLMAEFYRIRETSPGLPKLEALREAQLELLHGAPPVQNGAQPGRGVVPGQSQAISNAAAGELRGTSPPPNAQYAHPFFWAAFFLMGNWL